MSRFQSAAENCAEEMRENRRMIHRFPEIGRNEVKTSALIREKLMQYGVDHVESPVPTAVVALIHGKKGPGKCVALRADIRDSTSEIHRVRAETQMDTPK